MKFRILLSIIFFITTFAFLRPVSPVYSQTPTPTSSSDSKTKGLEDKIKEYQGKITELQGQGKTLSNQIKVMDSQISLTELRINSTQQQIDEVTKDIGIATNKVTNLEKSLEKITQVLLKRVSESYKQGPVQPLEVFLSSDSITSAMTRSQYLKIIQENDQKLLINTAQAKKDYENQKSIFQQKEAKLQALNTELQDYTKQLDQQKSGKETLLAVTKNSEAEYQKRLADALKELQQIQKASQVLVSTEPRHVNRGDPIGLMGNTGYSFGAHLHFGIYNITSLAQYNYYSNYENPANSLEAKNIDWDTGCGGEPSGMTSTGTGSFAWPMTTDNLHIEQSSGITCYSNVYYGGKPHPAFDMINKTDIVVRAVEEGQAYFCRNCTGDGANGVFIFHPNGKMSLYWHLQ